MQTSLFLGRAGSRAGHAPSLATALQATRHLLTAVETAAGILSLLSLAGVLIFFTLISMAGAR